MKKVLVIIPGYRESLNSIGYQEINRAALNSGYEIVFFDPQWNYRTLSNWVSELSIRMQTIDTKKSITLFGFSIGAMIALVYGSKENSVKIDRLILCSLSPYFSDDLTHIPKSAFKILGANRIDDFKKTKLPSKVDTKILYMVGEKEWDLTINRTKKAFKKIKSQTKNMIIIKNTNHDISENNYIKTIKKII